MSVLAQIATPSLGWSLRRLVLGACPCAVLRWECEGTLLGRRRVEAGLNGVPTVRRLQQSSQSLTRKIQTDVDASNYGESQANSACCACDINTYRRGVLERLSSRK